jgi:hypothetical protein
MMESKRLSGVQDSLPIFITSKSLQVKDHFTFDPKFFQAVKFAAIRGKNMHDHTPIISQHPARLGIAFNASAYFMFGAHFALDSASQGIDHTVTGTRTNNKIIRDRGHFADIQQQNILALFLLKNIDNGMSNL